MDGSFDSYSDDYEGGWLSIITYDTYMSNIANTNI